MTDEQKVACVMQITTKNGIDIQIGVNGLADYKLKKDALLKSTKEFITVIDTCTVNKSDISIIEYFEMAAAADNKRGVKKWFKK